MNVQQNGVASQAEDMIFSCQLRVPIMAIHVLQCINLKLKIYVKRKQMEIEIVPRRDTTSVERAAQRWRRGLT